MNTDSIPCECGCGEMTNPLKRRRFIHGHNTTVPRRPGKITTGDYRVEDRGFTSPCWIWQHGTSPKGYGIRKRKASIGTTTGAHRQMYEQTYGLVDPEMTIDHLCFQTGCVNPGHMEVVTPSENVRRSKRPLITAAQAEEVRRLRAAHVPFRTVAKLFGISPDTIGRVVRREFPYDQTDPRRCA